MDKVVVTGPPYGTQGALNTTSKSTSWGRDFSPFFLGPVAVPRSADPDSGTLYATNVENAWQYSKVYPEHADEEGHATKVWSVWREAGMAQKRAARYPFGKERRPLHSRWEGRELDYIEARRSIYIPIYARAVREHAAASWERLTRMHTAGECPPLWSFDCYDRGELTWEEIISNPHKKMGHGFVLAMMLEDYA